jgi:hypothetical protein
MRSLSSLKNQARISIDTELERIFGPIGTWDDQTVRHVAALSSISKLSALNAVAWLLAQTVARD